MNIAQKFKDQLGYIEKTVANTGETLTAEELDFNCIRVNTVGGATALILKPAEAAMQGQLAFFTNYGAYALTVVCAAGFGGVGSGGDTLTLVRGDMALVMCDGTYWTFLHNAAAG